MNPYRINYYGKTVSIYAMVTKIELLLLEFNFGWSKSSFMSQNTLMVDYLKQVEKVV